MNIDLPLITPASILERGTSALPDHDHPPAFCSVWMHLPDEDDPAEGVTVMAVGRGRKTDTIQMSAMEAAVILEVTRPGITIVTNRNTSSRSPTTTFYSKLILPDAAEDNMPVHRLLGGAEAGKKINRHPIIPTDLRGATNRKSGGPSKKDAWETVYGHCKRYAEKAAEGAKAKGETWPFTVEDYLANLEALYQAVTARADAEEAA